MKKYIFLAVLAISVIVFIYAGDDEKEVPSRPVLRVGMECDYAPNNWEEKSPSDFNVILSNQAGAYADGYDLQIAKCVADGMNASLEVKKIAWDDLIPALQRGEIDAIFSGMLDTEERRKQVAFSDPYEVNSTEYCVIVNTSSQYTEAKSLTDFSGAKFTGQKGTKLYASISQMPGAFAMPAVDTVSQMLDALTSGKADGIVINLDTGRSYEATYSNLKLIRFPEKEGFVIGFNGICAGVRKEDKELLHRINRVLSNITRSERQKIMDKTVTRLLHK